MKPADDDQKKEIAAEPVAKDAAPIATLENKLANILAQHGAELRRFLTGVCKNEETAADVMQATFVRAFQNPPQHTEGDLRAWVFQVAFHEALRLRRRMGAERRALEKIAWIRDRPSAAGDQSPEDSAIREESYERLRRAVDGLPPEQRCVVQWRLTTGATFAGIAQSERLPLGTVLTRMRSAMKRLRAALGDDAEEKVGKRE